MRLTRSERIDIFHLHSCPEEVLRRGDLQDALDRAVVAGKIGVPAYSGDNRHLEYAAGSGRFGSIEASINVVDQWNLRHVVPSWPSLGVIAKRPIANAPWRFEKRPVGDYAESYWERLRALSLDRGSLDWDELALRFTAHAPGVHTAIVGTANLANLKRNVAAVAADPYQPRCSRRSRWLGRAKARSGRAFREFALALADPVPRTSQLFTSLTAQPGPTSNQPK